MEIAEIKASLQLSDDEFGLVLVSSSGGSITGAQLSAGLVQKLGLVARLRIARLPMLVWILPLTKRPLLFRSPFAKSFWVLRVKTKEEYLRVLWKFASGPLGVTVAGGSAEQVTIERGPAAAFFAAGAEIGPMSPAFIVGASKLPDVTAPL